MGFEEASFKERYQETENSFRQESQKIENFKASVLVYIWYFVNI